MKNDYYPNDFIHGVLSAHCADETGSEAGKSKIKNGDNVKFAPENELYQLFLKDRNLDFNKFMVNWQVHEVIEDAETGYLGIIYENIETKQIVLAHRSTNFALGLTTKNLLKQSGVQTDIESALIGNIVKHQAYGYIATDNAAKYAKEKSAVLSITGHSLGAWLAELSVYYCNTVLNCKYVKGVTFDGPGLREMIEQMSSSNIDKFSPNSLYIVSYLSAPNIVNCANKHIGQVYRLFPDVESYSKLFEYFGKMYHDGLMATLGHDLKFILPFFNPDSGKPIKYEKVESWPSITHNKFGYNSDSFYTKAVNEITGHGTIWQKLAAKGINLISEKLLGQEAITIGSIATLIYDLSTGEINQLQFWHAHKYLNRTDGYNIGDISQVETFFLLYKGHYRCEAVNEYYFKVYGGIDKYFKRIKESADCKIKLNSQQGISNKLIQEIQELAKVYEYSYTADSFEIKARYQDNVTVNQLRDRIRILINNNEKAIKHIDALQLNNCQSSNSEQNISLSYKLKDIKALADSLTPNNILYESSNIKYMEEAKMLCTDPEVNVYISSANVKLEELLNYLWLQYSIANDYMWSHKGKEARETLSNLKESIKRYVLNQEPKLYKHKEYISDDSRLMQELKNDGMKVMLLKTLYSLGRTYFYVKDSKETAKKYLELIPKLAQETKILGDLTLQDLFEVHLSKANALGIIMREEAEYYIVKGAIKHATQKINETLQLYASCISDNTVYKREYDHNGQYATIIPSKDAYALAEGYEQSAKCYLDLARIDYSYITKALESIIGRQNPLFGYNVKLSNIPNKKAASVLNALSDVLLASADNINFENTKQQISQWFNHHHLKQELQANIEDASSMLDLIKAIAYIAKDKSRALDHTRADACKIIIEVLNNQIKDEENKVSSKQLDKLKEELEENQKEMININEDLNRNYSSILQPINLDNQCQDIASVFQDNAYKNGVLSLEIIAKNVGEELKYNVIYNNREHCIEEILKLEIASQIPSDDLGQVVINAAKEGYANYVLSIISNTDIYSKVDKSNKITALSIAANHLGSCVKFCFEEHNKCHYIQPISSFYQWLSFFKGQCITIQPTENMPDIKGPSHYSEVITLLGSDLFQQTHDEL